MDLSIQAIAQFFQQSISDERIVTSFTFDSRAVKKGSLFFALKGEKVDGHTFLEEIAKKGAFAAVVSENYRGNNFGMVLIFVDDVKQGLQALARHFFRLKAPLVIGVTGTVGKTTTKEFIAEILSEKFRVEKTVGSQNSQVSLPLTLLNWKGEDEILVLEMGMSQKGELARLVEIAPPDIGVLTKISLAHAAFFSHLDEIAEEKCTLFQSKKMTRAFVHQSAQVFQAAQNISAPITWFDQESFPAPFTEPHLLENLGAAIAIARHLGMTDGDIARGAKKLKPFKHRGEKIEKKGALFIDDSYNASPASMKAALNALPQGKRRMALFGAMKELGTFEKESHLSVAKHALPLIDTLLCIGKECQVMVDLFQEEGKEALFFETKKEAANYLKQQVERGDVVLLKGSNSFALWTVLEEID
ncbi:MAG: hypothetical protein KDK71_05480 [Chlamydiia bacterium]|nr:hypothetical protein [Chlamydiia bacterium]